MNRQLTAIIEREGNGYVPLYPEVDVASQGHTVDEARANLKEARSCSSKPLRRRRSSNVCTTKST